MDSVALVQVFFIRQYSSWALSILLCAAKQFALMPEAHIQVVLDNFVMEKKRFAVGVSEAFFIGDCAFLGLG